MATSVCYLSIFSAAFTFPILSDKSAIGLHGVFWLYSAIAGMGLTFTIFLVKEPSGTIQTIREESHPHSDNGGVAEGKFKRFGLSRFKEKFEGHGGNRRKSS